MDPIANMLITIKNGYMAKKQEVVVPYSKFKMEIAKVLEASKLIGKIAKADSKIQIELLYENKKAKITEIKRVSKLGLRVYAKSKDIKKIKGGKGFYIISTPKGVMTGQEAKAKNLGGEVICQIW
ncbi:30S ribosomal protein S8 [Candidatus Curtissbacteria bacterium]|nr:30S ribosomal protein S8 [Candidatus Curtissbacteria bacterium]